MSHQRDRIPHPDALRPYDSEGQLPIVIANHHRFFQLSYYWRHELGSRLYYLTSREAELRFMGKNTGDIAVSRFAPWAALNIRPYDKFVSQDQEFLFLQHGGWQKDQLLSDSAQLDLQGTLEDYRVYVVRLPDGRDRDPVERDLVEGS